MSDKFKAFSMSKIAPVMTDYYVVKEHAIIFHDIHADRAKGYPGFLPHLSLLRGEYGDAKQSELQMKFLPKFQWCHIASFKHDDDKRLPMVLIGTVYHNYHLSALIIIFIFPGLLPKIP